MRRPFDAVHRTYLAKLYDVKAVTKVNAQAGQSGAVSKTSVKQTARDDDFQEAKRCKKHISNNTLQRV
jgi:hypothetical protein